MEAGALIAQTDSASRARPSAILGRDGGTMDAISKWAQFVGRVALGLIFVISGAGKLAAWHGTVAYAASKPSRRSCS